MFNYREALTILIKNYNIIQHGELVPFLLKYAARTAQNSQDIEIKELYDIIDNMVANGEIKRVIYTLPDTGNHRVKSILFHPDAEIFIVA